MIVQGLGAEMLTRLLKLDRPGDDDAWLLFGPNDPLVVEPAETRLKPAATPLRWAAE